MAQVDDSFAPLAEKGLFKMRPPILGRKPVCVVKCHPEKDLSAMYAAGVKAGNGTKEEREQFRNLLDGYEQQEISLQKQYLGFSTNNHYMETDWCGHNLQFMEPEKVVDAVKWTLAHLDPPKS